MRDCFHALLVNFSAPASCYASHVLEASLGVGLRKTLALLAHYPKENARMQSREREMKTSIPIKHCRFFLLHLEPEARIFFCLDRSKSGYYSRMKRADKKGA